jgi:hypothetical protein
VVAKDELDTLLAHPLLPPSAPLLLLANKSDLPAALGAADVAQARPCAGRRGGVHRGAGRRPRVAWLPRPAGGGGVARPRGGAQRGSRPARTTRFAPFAFFCCVGPLPAAQ